MRQSILYALAAAALFGGSTPIAKWLGQGVSPFLLAGLLYAGSGIGLNIWRYARDGGLRRPPLPGGEWQWLLLAIFFGGVLGPVALMRGLQFTSGATASLLLNLEAVMTALIAWLVFREHTDRRMVSGMMAIVAGGLVLAWSAATENAIVNDFAMARGGVSGGVVASSIAGPAWIALACICWAIDNNLTRKVSASDAVFIAGTKGAVAGFVNIALALGLGAHWPSVVTVATTLLLGFCGYGISLVLFVLALRGLGSARAGAYFSTAPFLGTVVALVFFAESTTPLFWLAAGFMVLGVWLHVSERHAHRHVHDHLAHAHVHTHDAHHQHDHVQVLGGSPEPRDGESHSHWHVHTPLEHAHAHYPDIHHRHSH